MAGKQQPQEPPGYCLGKVPAAVPERVLHTYRNVRVPPPQVFTVVRQGLEQGLNRAWGGLWDRLGVKHPRLQKGKPEAPSILKHPLDSEGYELPVAYVAKLPMQPQSQRCVRDTEVRPG